MIPWKQIMGRSGEVGDVTDATSYVICCDMPNDNEKGKEQGRTESPRTPRRVQWASKNLVEHFEQVPLRDEDEDDDEGHSRALDEYGKDPAAIEKLQRALESFATPTAGSKPAPRTKNIPRLRASSEDDEIDVHSIAESSQQGASRSVGPSGQDTEVYIDPAETAGMPLSLSPELRERLRREREPDEADVEEHGLKEEKYWEKKAQRMVQAYTKRGYRDKPVSEEDYRSQHRLLRFRGKEKRKERSNEKEHDVEANAQAAGTHIKPLPLGRDQSILGTLLSLYRSQTPSSSASELTDGSTTPYDTDMESVASSDGHEYPRRSPPMSYFDSRAPMSVGLSPEHAGLVASRPETPPTAATSPGAQAPPGRKKKRSLVPPLPSPGGSIILPPGHPSHPKAALNAGGVIGALIATTNNLAGPAAPVPSTVGPDVSRRGFRLTRYKLKPEYPIPPSRPYSEPKTPPSTPTSAAESSGSLPLHHPSPQLRGKRPGWLNLTEVKPHERISIKAEKYQPVYEASTRAYEEGKEHGKSYRKAKKERRRTVEIYITKHVSEVLQRQEFILKLARALMMFAGPGHRLQAILRSAARVLDLEISSLHLPNVILISFGDPVTSTSNVKLIQQGGALDLEKLLMTQRVYWKVIHDEISVSAASASLDLFMHSPPRYNKWQTILFGGLCSSAICSLSFSGSFVDALVVFPLGGLLVAVQMISARNELYTNVFEIAIATFLSFISAALASTRKFCYAAVASSSVVLILPGFFVLSGSLELASRQIISGAVRVCFAVIYALFLGFGLAIGVVVYSRITHLQVIGPDDYTCGSSHDPHGPWWQRSVPLWWAFLTVPLFSLGLSLRNQAPIWRKEMAVTIAIACGGWAANHFSGVPFKNRPDIQSAIGAITVGVVANIYGRFFYGNAYVVMITGILFQLPSGLANGGLLTFAATSSESHDSSQQFESYEAGFKVAAQLIAVAIGLTVGLFISVVIVHPLGGSRRRASALFSL